VGQIYVLRAPVANYVEDISETFEIKLQALRAHKSQVGAHFEQLEARLRKEHRELGSRHHMTYAEEFYYLENSR
jgi:LmbE family N-acetylglucosaminyl deacetylase